MPKDRTEYQADYYQRVVKPKRIDPAQPPVFWKTCVVCGAAVKGTVRRLYCSNRCRQRAKRARSLLPSQGI